MKIRLKYRLHMGGKVLHPGELTEVSELLGKSLIESGNAEAAGAEAASPAEGKDHTLQALRQTQEQRDAAEKEVFALRDQKAALEKQVAALKEALKKAKSKNSEAETPKDEGGQ